MTESQFLNVDRRRFEGFLYNGESIFASQFLGCDQICANLFADALHQGLHIVLQPILCACTRKHYGFEALARLTLENKLIHPSEFIPLAERIGLISLVRKMVLKKSLEARCRIANQGLNPGRISINVSTSELCEKEFLESVLGTLSHYQIQPSDLTIEITETTLVDFSMDSMLELLSKIRTNGVKIAFDDFGTGFSSISRLKYFCPDEIKIDKLFTVDIKDSQLDRVIISSIVSLAHELGLKVVAEGVETKEQEMFLHTIGCDFLQGYLYATPLTELDAIDFLQNRSTTLPELEDAPYALFRHRNGRK